MNREIDILEDVFLEFKKYSQLSYKLNNDNSVRLYDDGYGSQGDSNEIYEVYDIGLEGGVFIELQIGSDSYGHDEFVTGIKFVQAQEKKITVYEYKG